MYIFLAGNLPSYRASPGSHGEKNTLGISICFLTSYNGQISWLAMEYGLYIYFGVNLNEVRDMLLHFTQCWPCTAASRGEVAPL